MPMRGMQIAAIIGTGKLALWENEMKNEFRIALLLIAAACVVGCHRQRAMRPPPQALSPRNSFEENYTLVGNLTRQHFPTVAITLDPYDSWNGYIMGFRVNTANAATSAQIANYAKPLWVQIRGWSGMSPADAKGCTVMVYDARGNSVSR